METNRKVKVVYVDNSETKVLKGLLVEECIHTITICLENSANKTVMIGKQALVKVTYINEGHLE